MAPHNVFSFLCLISRKLVFNAMPKLIWITWEGESQMRVVGFPPNTAICKNLVKPKVPHIPRETASSFKTRKYLLEVFSPLLPLILTFCV